MDILEKYFQKFSVTLSFFATGLKNFKALFRKKIFGKFLKLPKFLKINTTKISGYMVIKGYRCLINYAY